MNSNQLSGGAALQYRGTNAANPPNVVYVDRAPTVNDYKNFVIGDLWVNKNAQTIYALVDLTRNGITLRQEAVWRELGSGAGTLTFNTDMGSAVPSSDQINIVGGSNVLTSGSGNTITVTATGGSGDAASIVGVGLGSTSTASALYISPYGGSTSGIEANAEMTIPSSGDMTYLTITPVANTSTTDVTFTLRINGAATALAVTIPAGSTTPVTNLVDTVSVNQGDVMTLEAGQSSVGTITYIASWGFQTSGGGGGGVNSVNAGTGITITGPATDPIVNLTTPVIVANGGSGATTLTGVLTGNGAAAFTASPVTQYGAVIAGASNTVTSVAPTATAGVPLISQGAASNPAFGTAVVAGGGTGSTSFTEFAPVCGGTTTTGALQSAATGIANAGYVLTSTGVGSLPTWQPTSASTVTSLKPGSDPVVSPSAGIINFVNSGGISLSNGGANNFNIGISNYIDKTSWTPDLYFGGSNTGIIYQDREGYYARLGNIMFVWGTFKLTNKGSATGAATILGSPVPLVAYPSPHPLNFTVSAEYISFDNNSYVVGVFNTSTTIQFRIIKNNSGVPNGTLDNTNFTNSSGMTFTAWYFTT